MILCKYSAECLQVTPGTGASTGTPIQYLAKQLSWQLLSEENCFQVSYCISRDGFLGKDNDNEDVSVSHDNSDHHRHHRCDVDSGVSSDDGGRNNEEDYISDSSRNS